MSRTPAEAQPVQLIFDFDSTIVAIEGLDELARLALADDPQRARTMLQSQAKLEFWETYRINDEGIVKGLTDADLMLSAGDSTSSSSLQGEWGASELCS